LEAELFGFERGAFTDARRAKAGLFQAAHGGVLFLDEIGLLPDPLQAKLLTAIEERAVRRLGGTRSEPADVWLISATNADLKAAVRARRFREDLYHRLAVLTVDLPPLRARGRDVLLLAERFLARACAEYELSPKRLDSGAQARLLAYEWPGNIRELGNVIERAAVFTDTAVVTAESLGSLQANDDGASPAPRPGAWMGRDEAKRQELLAALEEVGGNISHAAAKLGIARNTVYARVEKFGLRPDRLHKAGPAQRPPAAPAAGSSPSDGGLRWERRTLALLRVDLSNADGVDDWSQSSRALEGVIAKVHSFGGRVEELTPTGLVAAFGLDPAEDAPRWAAHAAMAIQKLAARAREANGREPDVVIGLHVAPVLIGRVRARIEIDAGGKRAQWPVLDQLLEGRAPGETLASAEAGRFLERRFEMVQVDGQNGRAPVYRLTGREQRGLGPWGAMTRFVGRRLELEILRSRLAMAEGSHGQVMAVVGAAGVGKSRLIYEVAHAQGLDGWRVLEATAVSYGQAMSYLPTIALLRGYFAIQDRDDPREVREKVAGKLLKLDAAPTLPALLALLDVPVDDAAWRALDPPQRRQRTLDAVRRVLLRETREQPLLLIFEDLHWIDSETQALLDGLVGTLGSARLLLLVSYRPEYQHAWGSKTSYSQLRLDALPADQTGELLDALLGEDPGLVPVKQLLAKRGNPFFLEETVRTLVETRALDGPRGGYRLMQPVPALQIPPTVQAVLAARINRLTPEDTVLLQTAAVVGKDVPVALLQAIVETDETAMQAGLAHLQEAEFLYEVQRSREEEYTFKHALTHEVAYGSLLQDRRRDLHAKVAEAIERIHGDHLAEHVERLAHHTVRGEAWEKAVAYAHQAGRKALDRSAAGQAGAYLDQALEALARLPVSPAMMELAIDLRFERMSAHAGLGEFDRALQGAEEALLIAQKLEDQRRIVHATSAMGNALWQLGENLRARDLLDRAFAIAEKAGDVRAVAEAGLNLGMICRSLGDNRRVVAVLKRTVNILTGERASQRFGRYHYPSVVTRNHLARSLADLGEFRQATVVAEEAIRLAEALQQPASLIVALASCSPLLLRGEFEPAITRLERALALLSTPPETDLSYTLVANWLGYAYTMTGRPADALALLEPAVERVRRVSRREEAVVTIRLGQAYLAAGRTDDAMATSERALALSRERSERGHEAEALHLLGEITSRRDPADPEDAETRYREAAALSDELAMRPLLAHCHLGLGKLHRRNGRGEPAREHLAIATTMYREMEMRFWLESAEAEQQELTG
jgi:tetratricopeptide (TPR) repeat protein